MYHYSLGGGTIFYYKKFLRIVSAFLTVIIAFSLIIAFCPTVAAEELDRDIAVEKMTRGFYNFESKIDMSGCGVTPQNIGELFIYALKNDPYLFFVDTKLSYLYSKSSGKMEIYPKYNMSAEDAASALIFCKSEIKRLAAMVDNRMTDAEKALYIHDLICAEYSYDLSYKFTDMLGFLSTKTGTCQGYAWTYMAVMRELGVESCYVASDSLNHIWNMVRIDGEWYHCDLTWDDNAENISDHRHFLNSDKKAASQGHKDWYSAYDAACPSEKFDGADLSPLTHKLYSGDADHSDVTELYDLLLMRRSGDICGMCADLNADGVDDERDLEILRATLLGIN